MGDAGSGPAPTLTATSVQTQSVVSGTPVWRDENTGEEVDVYNTSQSIENIHKRLILSTAIQKKLFQYITDGRSIYIDPNTYFYYVGTHPKTYIDDSFYNMLSIPANPKNPPQINRIFQEYPRPRFIMLTNNFLEGTLNPVTTEPAPTQAPYPKITIIQNALDNNNANLNDQRFNVINTQETLNALTNKLNNLKLKLNTLTKKPMYSASGQFTFY
jgi:hypothetical protein